MRTLLLALFLGCDTRPSPRLVIEYEIETLHGGRRSALIHMPVTEHGYYVRLRNEIVEDLWLPEMFDPVPQNRLCESIPSNERVRGILW